MWVAEIQVGTVKGERRAEIVGFAGTSPARDDDPPRDLELATIYLLAAHHGSGLGQALLDAAIGDRPALLWVLEGNARAIRAPASQFLALASLTDLGRSARQRRRGAGGVPTRR